MDIQTNSGTIEVRITYGNPVWKPLKEAGFAWNRLRKCYQAADSPARRRALADMEEDCDSFEATVKSGEGVLLRHRKAYDYRDRLRSLGGRWNADFKGWVMPNQQAYDQALEICEGREPARKIEPVRKQMVLYTSEKDEPLRKGGVHMVGAMPDAIFWRAMNNAMPWKFYSGAYLDHFTGQTISTGFGWTYDVEEVTGEERKQLLS